MIDLTPEQIAGACGATLLSGDSRRTGPEDAPGRAVVDSRTLEAAELFVGLRGERADGGRFAEQAVEAGAWGVLVSQEHAERVASALPGRSRVLAAADPLEALGRLARAWLDRLSGEGCRVVGITGSTGKTSTKDILQALLAAPLKGRVHASRENYNTEVGLPLAVLEAEPGTEVMVLEMAMRGPGQIRALSEVAPPAVGVITNVGPVHLELLRTVEAVAEAKAELIRALPAGGVCVVPAVAEALRPHLRREVRTLTFGHWPAERTGDSLRELELVAGAGADVRVLQAEPAPRTEGRNGVGLRAEVAVGPERALFEFNFRQAHNLVNALAAIGAAHALDIPLDALTEGARRVRFPSLRGEEIELRDGLLVINDCYNANPMSMRAALDHLAQAASYRRAPRRVAVLGDMAELGPAAAGFHREVGEHAARSGVGLLVAAGELARGYVEGFSDAGEVREVADALEAARVVPELVEPGDVVLVKGSRSVGLERVTESLEGRGSP